MIKSISINNKFNIDNEKIEKVVSLLPKEYMDLDVEIRIYGTLLSLLKIIINRKIPSIGFSDFIKIYLLKMLGSYSGAGTNIIEIYLFNIKENKIQNLIFDLYHELHHKYQSINMKEFYDNEYANYKIPKNIKDMDAYFENKLEVDANNFALKFYNDNKETIDKTFELDDDYEIVGTGQK
ncbi:hypothetical protein [Clostridium sp.]|jgi:hypothetical protein|uniref:hypothetical protein n=1 Tax=Clostridium sp. TaxID=1506 RepID=UPI002587B44D|nr:hypothetical protein [Clostridium sp.]MDF2505236.1 hypothetical protein [Clostridium sp.]